MATILHTSDTHLDVLTYNESRAADHDEVMAEIVEIARDVKPDIVLHTGDLFHSVRPSTEAMHRAMAWLKELDAASRSGVIVVCGNHESANLFRLFNLILGNGARIRFVDKARLPRQGGVLDLPGSKGQRIRVASLPFIHANRILSEEIFGEVGKWTGSYADYVSRVEQVLGQGLADGYDVANDVLVFAAHLHVAGAMFSGSERRLHITDIYGSTLEALPPVNLAAFGHIHRPQSLPGSVVTGEYAGSPIPIDFGEVGETKSVVVYEAAPQAPTKVTRVPLSGGRPLWRFAGTLDELAAQASDVGRALALVTVKTVQPAVDLADQVQDLLPKATLLYVAEECSSRKLQALTRADAVSDEADFTEMFADFLSQRGTKVGSADRVLKAFKTLIDAVGEEAPPPFPEEAALASGAVDPEAAPGKLGAAP
jgi:DNA repair protein SbcD/Mre11